jgi:RNA polymerase sigma-70 factor (ECF subfamily)
MATAVDTRHERFKNEMLPHLDSLYSFGVYLAGDRDRAKDLLQETYLKAYRFLDKFEPGTNARAWLYRIMRNTYINDYRRIRRAPDLVEYDDQTSGAQMLHDVTIDREHLSARINEDLFDDEIAVALQALPEKYKSVVVLRDVEDLPYEEIAEALEIPIGTVRSRLHRARALLFDRLKKYAQAKGYQVGKALVPQPEYALAG